MERLRKLREPAAIALLTAVAIQIVLVIGAVGAGHVAASQLSRSLVIAAALVVGSCVVWGRPTPHARVITLVGAVLFAADTVLAFVLALVGMFEPGGVLTMLTVLLELLIPALAAVVLFLLRGGLPAGSPTPAPNESVRQPFHGSQTQQPPPSGYAPSAPGQFHPMNQPPRSQPDQFGNPHSNSPRPNPNYSAPDGGTQPWQPVAQTGPQRLEPSPYTPPVGPHTQPETGRNPSGTDSQGGPEV